jgi:hypothetical protein
VTSFTASSTIVNASTDRSTLQFSWTTEDADYVEFSYHCSAYGLGLVILEQGGSGGRNCENDPKPITQQTEQVNHPPNSDVEVAFGNSHHEDPISIVVRMTPFSHGRAYSAASKTITIRVDPYNPYPKGIPTSTANITIRYAGSPKNSYELRIFANRQLDRHTQSRPLRESASCKRQWQWPAVRWARLAGVCAARGCRNLYLDNSCEVLGKRLSGLCCCAGTGI